MKTIRNLMVGVMLATPLLVRAEDSVMLLNPLTVDSIEELLALILDVVIIFAVPIIIFFIIYSGFLYVTAQGKPDQIKKATTAFTWTVIGGVIILAANILLIIIQNTVEAL